MARHGIVHHPGGSSGCRVRCRFRARVALACCRVLTVPRVYTILASGLTIPSVLLGGYAARWRAGKAHPVSDARAP